MHGAGKHSVGGWLPGCGSDRAEAGSNWGVVARRPRDAGLCVPCRAYLAVRTLNDLPIAFPKTAGAPQPLVGGVVARP